MASQTGHASYSRDETIMKHRRVYLDTLLGQKVYDPAGQCAGRIEEVVARTENGQCIVEEFHLGRVGLLQRLSVAHFAERLIAFLGARSRAASHSAAWDQIDLTNPEHPRLRCLISDLKQIE
jgi:hypothetical protein